MCLMDFLLRFQSHSLVCASSVLIIICYGQFPLWSYLVFYVNDEVNTGATFACQDPGLEECRLQGTQSYGELFMQILL